LIDIAVHLAKQTGRQMESMQLFVQANEVTKTIEDPYIRGRALSGLGQALAQAQQWERAEAVWHDAETAIAQIKDTNLRERALSGLGEALAQAQQWKRAEAVIAQIKNAKTRGRALFRLIEVLQEMKHERGLVVVQHAWLRAITRDEALSLLQIATPFIVFKPELGVAFFEAFAWVDTFLKG
jgi:thioredoxin-like negative regulator of GroEL